jgi:hypothetical protein
MSTSPESGSPELGLDLDLHFLPAWAQQPTENQYAKFEGGQEPFDRRRGDHRERRPDRGPRRPEGRGPGQGPRGDRGPGREAGRSRPLDQGRRPERFEPPAPPIEVDVAFIPEDKGVESLARQIRLTGRAYPLFDVAYLILKKPDRYNIRFGIIKKADGQVAQGLFVCALDDTLWLSEQEAVDFVLGKHFATFYQAEKTPTEPPKGTYTFVAQCGISGTILGPPNYHDYQNKLRKLHAERFSRMAFEMFKSRIKIVRDEAVVKKWLEDQSWKTEYVCLNVPDTMKVTTREEVEQHFRQTHLANVIKPVESHTLSGTAAQNLPMPALQRLVRRCWDDQMRFPLRMVNVLSQQFAGHGLQFFKVNRTVTHVAVARPRYLDFELTPVSDGVRKIVDFIQATQKCTRRKILEALAPITAPAVIPAPASAPADSPQPAAQPVAQPAPSPEMAVVISDLHWLIHQGHVIEFASGLVELAKKPLPKPPKPEPAPAAEPAAAAIPATTDTEPPHGDALAAATEAPAPAPNAGTEAPAAEQAPAQPPAEPAVEAPGPEPAAAASETAVSLPPAAPEPSVPAVEPPPTPATQAAL